MHRLFWKIFLSFWISLILFAGASLLAASLFLERTRTQDEIESPRARHLTYINEAQFIAENDGIDGLKLWLKKLDRKEAIPFLLIDADGKDLLDRPVSAHLSKRLARISKQPRRSERGKRPPRRRDPIQLPDGSEYRLMPDFQSVTLNRVLSRPRVIAAPVILAAIISGLVSLLLARYLTIPVQRLRRATRQFSSGDFDVRTAHTMGKRQDEIAGLAHDFDQMAERLQTLIRSQKQLLTDVSHELRSPLARLQVALGLARQRGQNHSSDELDRIEREAEQLNELIGQLLSLSRLESGTTLNHKEAIELSDLLEDVVKDTDFEARAINREVRFANGLSASIEANEVLLRSAFENIVRNAVRYTDEFTTVDLSLKPDYTHVGWLVIEVRDHGPGVPENMLTKLFEPFVRVSDARERQSGGYGLGLAIAERAIRTHGGKVSASNHPGGGLTVYIHLPIDQMK